MINIHSNRFESRVSNKIRNIIFDLGNVLIPIDFTLTHLAFRKLSDDFSDDSFSFLRKQNLFYEFETGLISPVDFRNAINSALQKPLANDLIDEAWNALLLDLPEENLRILQKLGLKYRLFLLSNTNAIHVDKFNHQVTKDFNINFESLFEKVYYSHVLHLRKPDCEIYKYVLNDSKLDCEETLFIDDVAQNIEGAQQVGLLTHHLKPNEKIADLFNIDSST